MDDKVAKIGTLFNMYSLSDHLYLVSIYMTLYTYHKLYLTFWLICYSGRKYSVISYVILFVMCYFLYYEKIFKEAVSVLYNKKCDQMLKTILYGNKM